MIGDRSRELYWNEASLLEDVNNTFYDLICRSVCVYVLAGAPAVG